MLEVEAMLLNSFDVLECSVSAFVHVSKVSKGPSSMTSYVSADSAQGRIAC